VSRFVQPSGPLWNLLLPWLNIESVSEGFDYDMTGKDRYTNSEYYFYGNDFDEGERDREL